jgi:hypothetical protein
MANPPTRAAWRKSSHSGNGGNCIETAILDHHIAIRDSTNPTGRPRQDADGLHPVNFGQLVPGFVGPLPCTGLSI